MGLRAVCAEKRSTSQVTFAATCLKNMARSAQYVDGLNETQQQVKFDGSPRDAEALFELLAEAKDADEAFGKIKET